MDGRSLSLASISTSSQQLGAGQSLPPGAKWKAKEAPKATKEEVEETLKRVKAKPGGDVTAPSPPSIKCVPTHVSLPLPPPGMEVIGRFSEDWNGTPMLNSFLF